jgi:hypothetical protein
MNVLVRSPDAVTAWLSQIPIALSNILFRAIVMLTGVPPR